MIASLDRAHLVGIGGRGMGSLARALLELGLTVSGSDKAEGPRIEPLRSLGATITIGHDASSVADASVVVTNAAIPAANPEIEEAHARGIPVLHRAEAVAMLMGRRRGIAVAGTHGKTTTASMIALILEQQGMDPTFVIGGDRYEGGPNGHGGVGEWMVAEADESDASLVALEPEIAVITNIDGDHLNFYRDLDHIKDTFVAFVDRVHAHGTVVISATDPGAGAIRDRISRRVVSFGLGAGDWTAERAIEGPGRQRMHVRRAGETLGEVALQVPGEHNVVNALGAIAACDVAGVGFADAARALAVYRGVPRRFDVRGVSRGVTVVDDHAHNPAEIVAALQTAHEQSARAVVAVFQPHLYSRTKLLARELGEALTGADRVVVTAVDGAREDPIPGITGRLVVDALLQARPDAAVEYVPERSQVAPAVARIAREGDLVMTIGCGDVTLLVAPIIEALSES